MVLLRNPCMATPRVGSGAMDGIDVLMSCAIFFSCVEALRQTQNTLFCFDERNRAPQKKQTVTNKVIFFVCAPIALIYRIGNIADTTHTHKKTRAEFILDNVGNRRCVCVRERLMIHH